MPSSRGLVVTARELRSLPRTEQSARLLSLAKRDDGAIIAFGVFFGVLLLGLLYYMIGLGATMYYRERLQDAADGSAFASAVVHARGMNTLALINVVMAALLAVLVALRLVEALIIIAEVILYALSWLGGATAAIASALEVVRQAVKNVADAASPVIVNVNKVLKVGGEVVRVAVPIASNLSVLGKVANRYDPEVKAGLVIPPRFTLPAEDDTFPYLCKKAGTIAGTLALLPIKPILPSGLRKKLAKALGSLTSSGSTWFCDGSAPPEYETEPEVNDFPASEKMAACTNRDKGNVNSADTCRKAEEEEGRGEPDEKTGLCRQDQPVCQVMIDAEGFEEEGIPPGQVVPYSPHSWCGSEEGAAAWVTEADCHMIKKDGREYPDVLTPYGARLAKARVDCDPKFGDRYDYWWMERELDVTWEWVPAVSEWAEIEAVESIAPTPFGRPPVSRTPCKGIPVTTFSDYGEPTEVTLDATWNASPELDKPVCVLDAPKPSAPVAPTDPTRVTLRRTEVTQILGCSNKDAVGEKVVVEAINLGADQFTEGLDDLETSPEDVGGEYGEVKMDDLGSAADSGGDSSSEDTVPFRFIKGHRLGTSDMQLRSLIIGTKLGDTNLEDKKFEEEEPGVRESIHNEALRVIGVTRWGQGEGSNTLSKASEIWGRFTVAQAEYYFDTSKDPDVLAEWKGWDTKSPEDSGRDFLWAMNWTARMRRFRLSYDVDGENADGESNADAEASDTDKMARKLDIEIPLTESSDKIASDGPAVLCDQMDSLKDACGQITEVMRSLDGVFIH